MTPLQRLGPYVYGALHSYNSLWELLLTRSERKTAERDAERLRERFPFLANYPELAGAARRELEADHRVYTTVVSPGPIALSLELAVFLAAFCEARRPNTILDLGSGFSSYVFRRYLSRKTGHEVLKAAVYSVDESAEWIRRTRIFLEERGVEARHLLTWEDFVAGDKPAFDLVLHDMGDLETRLRTLGLVLDGCGAGTAVILDDMHVPSYRRDVLRELDRRGVRHFSLRAFARKRLRYAYLVCR